MYAAGTFSKTEAPANPGNYIAKYDGTNWMDLGGGVIGAFGGNEQIHDTCIFNNTWPVINAS